jgi:hypothetical protein
MVKTARSAAMRCGSDLDVGCRVQPSFRLAKPWLPTAAIPNSTKPSRHQKLRAQTHRTAARRKHETSLHRAGGASLRSDTRALPDTARCRTYLHGCPVLGATTLQIPQSGCAGLPDIACASATGDASERAKERKNWQSRAVASGHVFGDISPNSCPDVEAFGTYAKDRNDRVERGTGPASDHRTHTCSRCVVL